MERFDCLSSARSFIQHAAAVSSSASAAMIMFASQIVSVRTSATGLTMRCSEPGLSWCCFIRHLLRAGPLSWFR